ncbi:MAG: hypothetical protein ACKN9E_09800 [Microcystaceae cyanobacterium]
MNALDPLALLVGAFFLPRSLIWSTLKKILYSLSVPLETMAVKYLRPLVKTRLQLRAWGSLLEFLLMTSAIALSAGIGFGAALRFGQSTPLPVTGTDSPQESEQTFPPLPDWPTVQPKLNESPGDR